MKTLKQWFETYASDDLDTPDLIEAVYNDGYNQCLEDLAKDDLLLNKEINIKKYKK